eukprot:1104290-Amphidinium_carterae.1
MILMLRLVVFSLPALLEDHEMLRVMLRTALALNDWKNGDFEAFCGWGGASRVVPMTCFGTVCFFSRTPNRAGIGFLGRNLLSHNHIPKHESYTH